MERTTKQQRALIPKPPKKRIVKRPKGDLERKKKEVAEKMKKVIKKPKGDAERKKKEVEAKLAKAKAEKKAGKKEVGKMTFKEIVDNEDADEKFQQRAEENAMDGINYGGISWIDGITASESRFYEQNHYRYDELSEQKQDKLERIEEKVNDGLGPSIRKELKRVFKVWKGINKDKKMTIKEAQNAFESYYF